MSRSSTSRRKDLPNFIDDHGTISMKSCSFCKSHKSVCRVHVRSGKCAECVRRGRKCDLQVTRSEWDRLRRKREKLLKALKEAREAQSRARE